MSIYVGSTQLADVGDIKIGSTSVQKVYLGSTQIWPAATPEYIIQDTFTDTGGTAMSSHTPDVGDWLVTSGQITSGGTRWEPTASPYWLLCYGPKDDGVESVLVEFEIYSSSPAGADYVIYLRAENESDPSSGDHVRCEITVDNNAGTFAIITDTAANGENTIYNNTNIDTPTDDPMTVSITMTDDYYELVIDISGSNVIDTNFTDTNAECVGNRYYGIYSSVTGKASCEYFQIYGIDIGPPPPLAPTSFAIGTYDYNYVNMTWTDNAGDADYQEIWRSPGGMIEQISGTAESYQDTTVDHETSYTYYVKACYTGGSCASSNTDNVTTPTGIPDAPTGMTLGTYDYNYVNMTWTDNADNETSYKVYRNGGLLDTIAANSQSYQDTTVDHETAYTYYVKASNSYGDSTASNTINVTTPTGIPDAPTLLAITAEDYNHVQIEWTDNADNETSYKIYRNAGLLDTIAANSELYDDTTISTSTYYEYYVKASNSYGDSTASNTVSLTTDPPPPAGSWDDFNNSETWDTTTEQWDTWDLTD